MRSEWEPFITRAPMSPLQRFVFIAVLTFLCCCVLFGCSKEMTAEQQRNAVNHCHKMGLIADSMIGFDTNGDTVTTAVHCHPRYE